MKSILLILPLAFAAAMAPTPARADTATCTRVTSLPAVLSTSGVYCLDHSLSTSATSGAAIGIKNHNIVLDCNGHSIDGRGAGRATSAVGVTATQFDNVTVRNCHVRGFRIGIRVVRDTTSGAPSLGASIVGNKVGAGTFRGIVASGAAGEVRDNLVYDVGGDDVSQAAVAIQVGGGVDAIDNTIAGVGGTAAPSPSIGILVDQADGLMVAGNRARLLLPKPTAFGISVTTSSKRVTLAGNFVNNEWSGGGTGYACAGTNGVARDNVSFGFGAAGAGCADGGGNVVEALDF